MDNEERFEDEIEDLEPAAEEAEDVKGGLNFANDPAMKFKVQEADPPDPIRQELNYRQP